ncbi:Mov34/MPN/PAD-1 family protein, partial [Mycobacterium sp. SMC-4]|uniref:Mov34/MPN/PAD-1 family protein n=1 Tax=Mycobacterium sp. SMC-4 TaxID=2857059 RepID=UPI003D0427BC
MPAHTRLLLAESARATLTAAAAHAHPCETGGILIGVLADGHPWVTAAIEIATTDRGRARYRIPGGATHAAVQRSRATDDRLGYLGDWHTHPADAGPSPTDRRRQDGCASRRDSPVDRRSRVNAERRRGWLR